MVEGRFSPRAERDIQQILIHGIERHGIRRATAYVEQFRAAGSLLSEFPHLGRLHETARGERFLRHSVGRHVLFYVLDDDGPRIVRILHQAMDFDRHL